MPTIFASSTQYGNLSARKIDLDNSFYSITSNELLLVPTPLCVYGKNSHQKKKSFLYTSVHIFKTSVGSNLKMLNLEPSKPPICSRKPNLAKCTQTTKKPNRSEPQTFQTSNLFQKTEPSKVHPNHQKTKPIWTSNKLNRKTKKVIFKFFSHQNQT